MLNSNKTNTEETSLNSHILKVKCAKGQDQFQKTSELIKISYTIKQGDQRRLNKNGVLKVYNVDQLIEIPVTMLLGKWQKNHIGITIFKLNEEWETDGYKAENIINNKVPFKHVVKGLMIKIKPLYLLEKVFNNRMNENNMLKDA